MSEPLLVFKKGEGWVYQVRPECPASPVFTARDGRRFHIEVRNPEVGEFYEESTLEPEYWKECVWNTEHAWVRAFQRQERGFGKIYVEGVFIRYVPLVCVYE